MEMSKEEFMMLHERLLDRLDRLEHKIESLSTIGGKQMLDNRDMRLLLKVCDRTLLRWRRSRNLRGFRISGKVYYMAADVHRFLLSVVERIKTISMKKNSKVIVLERNRFAMLVKVHRKSLLMLEVLTYICRIRNIDLVMTLEEVCHVLRMDAAVVEQYRHKGLLRSYEENGLRLYEAADLVRLKAALDMIDIYRRINKAAIIPSSSKSK